MLFQSHCVNASLVLSLSVAMPLLVIEIAASSAAIDLGDKKQAYRRNGVTEYLVWQVFENKIDWYALTDGGY